MSIFGSHETAGWVRPNEEAAVWLELAMTWMSGLWEEKHYEG